MFLRIFSLTAALGLLAACEATQSPEPEGASLDCAIGAGAEFDSVCTLEWIGEPWGQEFLIHHPGGGFRRFSLSEDSTEVTVKDGAEDVEMVTPSPEGFLQFSVSGDRYLMPAAPESGA